MKKIILPIIFFCLWLALCLFLGRDIEPDLSNEQTEDYVEGGVGHPLWSK